MTRADYQIAIKIIDAELFDVVVDMVKKLRDMPWDADASELIERFDAELKRRLNVSWDGEDGPWVR